LIVDHITSFGRYHLYFNVLGQILLAYLTKIECDRYINFKVTRALVIDIGYVCAPHHHRKTCFGLKAVEKRLVERQVPHREARAVQGLVQQQAHYGVHSLINGKAAHVGVEGAKWSCGCSLALQRQGTFRCYQFLYLSPRTAICIMNDPSSHCRLIGLQRRFWTYGGTRTFPKCFPLLPER